MTMPALAQIPVRSPAELTERWSLLLEMSSGDGDRSLQHAAFTADGRQVPLLVPVDDIPARPDGASVEGHAVLLDLFAEQAGPGGHVAQALVRPGTPGVTEDDLGWRDLLSDLAADLRRGTTWSLHLRAGGSLVPLAEPGTWTLGG